MASTYITKTMSGGSATTTKFTFSAWVKRTGLSSNDGMQILSVSNEYIYLGFFSDSLRMEMHDSDNVRLRSNAKFRDTNSWYHVVFTFDSTQATASDRMKMWVNNEQITSLDVANYPSLNYGSYIGGNTQHSLGRRENDDSDYFDGIISHAHLTVGYTYTPSAFGETDTTTGEWKAKTSPSVTYGTNGFFILKDGNGITDQSGEGNDFTLGGGTLTDLKDNPDNVFATMNPLVNINSNLTLSNGNNTMTLGTTSWIGTVSSLGINTGKWYWEIKVDANNFMHGILGETANLNDLSTSNSGYIGKFSNGYAFYWQSPNARKQNNNSGSTYGTAPSSGDILMVAFDATNGTIWVGKNGSWFNSATQSEIENGTTSNSMYSSIPMTETFFPGASGESNHVANYNFGNGYFGTTAITTNSGNGYSGAEGSSKFNYTVPTGYSALSTKGLNE